MNTEVMRVSSGGEREREERERGTSRIDRRISKTRGASDTDGEDLLKLRETLSLFLAQECSGERVRGTKSTRIARYARDGLKRTKR